ncbi:MAG: uroporphyrinogen III synthase [Phenylobacterium zucineum]|nr:MAG: uroporphyrinogen III synthase [Phenylobacterium zucineum]
MANRHKRIWITRTEPAATETAAQVRERGHDPWVAPLIEVRPLVSEPLDLNGVGALAFTSNNAVRAFCDLSSERQVRVFAVGAATAKAARAAGFRRVLSSDRDVSILAQGIVERRREITGIVLHPGALEPAGDLVAALESHGIAARGVAIYDTCPTDLSDGQIAEMAEMDMALIHSAKAAQVLADHVRQHPLPGLAVAGLSREAIKPLARTPLVWKAAASKPLEASLLDLIDQTP